MAASSWLRLPSDVLLTVFAFALSASAIAAPTPTSMVSNSTNTTIAPTGSGSQYASACWQAWMSFSEASSSWTSAHQTVSTVTNIIGGPSISAVTYYENATTLCDGHPRVTYSPAIPLSTGTVTTSGTVSSTSLTAQTVFEDFPSSTPNCTIKPSDCNGLLRAYSTEVSAMSAHTASHSLAPPPCLGTSEASSIASAQSEIYGCGECTIYGQGVELVYFPTSVSSRDMCASTPTAALTHYGSNDVITAYAGNSYSGTGNSSASGKRTAVVDGHTFTSGTAYISIATVSAVNRCSKTFGTPITDAILALPSDKVLSLRYSQDHFQLLMTTDQITGYPVSYADFNSPVPWSAWNGQNYCDPGGYGGYSCSIIYENSFRPQLAIPPQITDLSPDFKNCQMFYNGLWDPPKALTEASSAAAPTSLSFIQLSTPASPSSVLAQPTAHPTEPPKGASKTISFIYNPYNLDSSATQPGSAAPMTPQPAAYGPGNEPWVQPIHIGDHTYWATGANGQARLDGVVLNVGGPPEKLSDGTDASYGSDSLILIGSSTMHFQHAGSEATRVPASGGSGTGQLKPGAEETGFPTSGAGATDQPNAGPGYSMSGSNGNGEIVTLTINGHQETAVQTTPGGPIVVGTLCTLTPGSQATTLADGEVLSAATDGLVIGWTSTVGMERTNQSSSSAPGDRTSATSTSDNAKETSAASSSRSSIRGSSASSSATTASSTSSGRARFALPSRGMAFCATLFVVWLVGG